MPKKGSAQEAIACLKPGWRVFVHGAAATPLGLLKEVRAQSERLTGLELVHIHTMDPQEFADANSRKHLRFRNLFVGENARPYVDYDSVDYAPAHLSQMGRLFRAEVLPLNAALLQVSPVQINGLCSLGVSVDIARAALDSADFLIAEINSEMPYTHGDGEVPIDWFDFVTDVSHPLPNVSKHAPTAEELKIGEIIATLVEDGATIQLGIGAIPDAACARLLDHKNLGLHSEMWSDGALQLIKKGAINNSRKVLYPGVSVASFAYGSSEVYEFIRGNDKTLFLEASYVNNPGIIAQNPKVTCINSAVEIDLTGQVCSDSIGSRIISGNGGQFDFIRAASLADDGKGIIAITSRSKKGISRIVPQLNAGAGVVTPRSDTNYVVTEFGIAQLRGMTLRERAKALTAIAHPDDRENLMRVWHDQHRPR